MLNIFFAAVAYVGPPLLGCVQQPRQRVQHCVTEQQAAAAAAAAACFHSAGSRPPV